MAVSLSNEAEPVGTEPRGAAEGENRPNERGLSASSAAFFGWFAVALVNAAGIAVQPVAGSGLATRLVHLLFDFGQTLSLGLAAYGLTALWTRFGPPRRRWGFLAVALV